MNKVTKLFPHTPNGGRTVEVDGTLLLFAPMSEVRCAVQAHMHKADSCRLFAQVFRGAARVLVAGMIAPRGQRTASYGLHAHNAGRRAIELLDLAAELDAHTQATQGGGE